MAKNQKQGQKHDQNNKNKSKTDSPFIETKFGSRAVSEMNHSRVLALPKVALNNMCDSGPPKRMDVTLVQKGDESFLKLSPLCDVKKEVKK